MLLRQIPLSARAAADRCCPIPGTPFQLVHHDDVASALVAASRGAGPPGAYNLAGDGTVTLGDVVHALGGHTFPVPRRLLDVAALGVRLPLVPTLAQWIDAGRVATVMDTAKARRELRWRPRYSSRETLRALVSAE